MNASAEVLKNNSLQWQDPDTYFDGTCSSRTSDQFLLLGAEEIYMSFLVLFVTLLLVDRLKCVVLLASAIVFQVFFFPFSVPFVSSLALSICIIFAKYISASVGNYTSHKSAQKEISSSSGSEEEYRHDGPFLLEQVGNKKSARKSIMVAQENMKEHRKDIARSNALGSELIAKRSESLGSNVSCFYADEGGLVITKGEGSYMFDHHGNRYLDCCNNVAGVGHSHPRVVKAGIDALSMIQTNARFLHPTHQRYVDKLLKTFPSQLDTVYLVNSGSEANELALRMAKAHSELRGIASSPNDIICLDLAYHGNTQSLIDISPYKWYQSTDGKQYRGVRTHVTTLPDSFRGKYRGMSIETGIAYSKEVEEIVKNNGGVGVFIAESVVGCGGQVCLPPGYMTACCDIVRRHGGVVIVDEVQTGFARSGEKFWHFETYDIIPDIVTFGKPCGNGYPVAGVVCKREVADSFAKSGIEFFNTYGGNSVACSIAESVLDVIEDEGLLENAKYIGNYLTEKLLKIQHDFDCVGDVRGKGLFLGVEFVVSRENNDLTPDAEICKFVVDFLRFHRILISRDGPHNNVIKIKPPLVFGVSEADKLVDAIRAALEAEREASDSLKYKNAADSLKYKNRRGRCLSLGDMETR